MHPNPRRIIPILILIIALASFGYWYFLLRPIETSSDQISASGAIEATLVQISPELGGKTTDVLVGEGDPVKSGDVLVQFDASLLEAQRKQAAAAVEVAQAGVAAAQANLAAAQAQVDVAAAAQAAAQAGRDAAQSNLDLLKAGATAEQLRAAQAQFEQAQANLAAAQASYAALTAGARPEDVTAARSRLDWARSEYYSMTIVLSSQQIEAVQTACDTAQSNLEQAQTRKADLTSDTRTPPVALDAMANTIADAQMVLDAAQAACDQIRNDTVLPQQSPIYQQIQVLRQSLEAALLGLSQAKARQSAAQNVDDMTQRAKDVLQSTADDAQQMADDAQAAYEAFTTGDQADRLKIAWDEAQKALADLNVLAKGGATPLESILKQLDAAAAVQSAAQANYQNLQNGARPEQIAAAQAQVDAAEAQRVSAEANLAAAKARTDAAQAQVEAAQAQVNAAQAALAILDVQLAKLTISAPQDGSILTRAIEPGEVANPGAILFTLADLTRLTITVYVPEDRYGEIALGAPAQVTVDSYAGETFTATVIHIADKAEFTPRNVQTSAGRRTTVFAVKLSIDNAAGKLKPGMPADVDFGNP